MRPHALHPGTIQEKEEIKFCHLATLARESMNRFLEEMAKGGELRPPKHVLVPLADFRDALLAAQRGKKDGKYILDLRGEE